MFFDYVMMYMLFAPYACLVSTEARRGVYVACDWYEPLCGCSEFNLGPQQELNH